MVLLSLDKLTGLAREFRRLQSKGEQHMDLSSEDFINLCETCEALWSVVRAAAKYKAHSSVDCIISCPCEEEMDTAFKSLNETLA